LLVLGLVRRRAKRRRAAREALEDALAVFDALPAPLWARRARAELERLGGRRGSPDELTPSERRAADLILAGKTNREIATELFITVPTVEKTLTRAYAKLDVRSRTELARRLADPEARPAERKRHHSRRERRKVSGFPAFGPEAAGRGWVSAGLTTPGHRRADVRPR